MTPRIRWAAPAVLVLGLLVAAGAAQAALVLTPLRLSADVTEAEVGDAVDFTIEPENATAEAAFRGRTIRVAWEEIVLGEEGRAPTRGTIVEALRLDGDARGAFRWVVPAGADDKNVFVLLQVEGEDRLGQFHLRVGDAEPIAFTLGGPADPPPGDGGAPADDEAPADGEAPTGGDGTGAPAPPPRASTPGFEVLALLGGLGVVGLLAVRRRA